MKSAIKILEEEISFNGYLIKSYTPSLLPLANKCKKRIKALTYAIECIKIVKKWEALHMLSGKDKVKGKK